MYDLKLYSSNVIETELASRIGYISANIITKKRRNGKGKGKGTGKKNGEEERKREGKWVIKENGKL